MEKVCILPAIGADNTNTNPNNITFTIKDTKLYILVATLSVKKEKSYQNFLVKDLKNQFIGMNKKQKLRIKIRQMNTDILSNETLELRNYLYQFICIKAMM